MFQDFSGLNASSVKNQVVFLTIIIFHAGSICVSLRGWLGNINPTFQRNWAKAVGTVKAWQPGLYNESFSLNEPQTPDSWIGQGPRDRVEWHKKFSSIDVILKKYSPRIKTAFPK